MKIAVINEVSASLRNEDIMKALHKTTDAEILNVGMKTPEQMPSLTYIHTSYMAAILLNTGSCDFVVGAFETGQKVSIQKLFPKQPFSIRRYCQSCRFLALFLDLLQNPQ